MRKSTIPIDTLTAPAYWSSALINDDFSGLSDEEAGWCREWLAREGNPNIVSDVEDSSRFTWSYALYDGGLSGYRGGEVCDYIVYRR